MIKGSIFSPFVNYDPLTPANWPSPPNNAQEALDDLAASGIANISFGSVTGPYGGIDANTQLLLHLDTPNVFLDSSIYARPVSEANGTSSSVPGEFAQGLDVTSGGYPYVPTAPEYTFGTGNFTIDMWVKATGSSTGPLASSGVGSVSQDWYYGLNGDGSVSFIILSGAPSRTVATSAAGVVPMDGNYHHVAAIRNGSTFTMTVDGVSVASGAITEFLGATSNFIYFGGLENGSHVNVGSIQGDIDEVRLSVGVARWTSFPFVPPNVAYYTSSGYDFGSSNLLSTAVPSVPEDLINLGYLDTYNVPNKETIMLTSAMITAQQVLLAKLITPDSLVLLWSLNFAPIETVDYTLSTVGAVTAINFVPGGALNLTATAGQILQPSYLF